jgi:hypothetical protein
MNGLRPPRIGGLRRWSVRTRLQQERIGMRVSTGRSLRRMAAPMRPVSDARLLFADRRGTHFWPHRAQPVSKLDGRRSALPCVPTPALKARELPGQRRDLALDCRVPSIGAADDGCGGFVGFRKCRPSTSVGPPRCATNASSGRYHMHPWNGRRIW